jgi:hypothetical protein
LEEIGGPVVEIWCSTSVEGVGRTLDWFTTCGKSARSCAYGDTAAMMFGGGGCSGRASLPALKAAADNPEGVFTSAAAEAGPGLGGGRCC